MENTPGKFVKRRKLRHTTDLQSTSALENGDESGDDTQKQKRLLRSNAFDNSMASPPTTQKKKRGRKPKQVKSEEEQSEQTDVEQTSQFIKPHKKRGRKKKINAEVEEAMVIDTPSSVESEKKLSTKSKRGRKKKIFTDTEKEDTKEKRDENLVTSSTDVQVEANENVANNSFEMSQLVLNNKEEALKEEIAITEEVAATEPQIVCINESTDQTSTAQAENGKNGSLSLLKSIEKPFKKRKSNKKVSSEEAVSSETMSTRQSLSIRKKWDDSKTKPDWYATFEDVSPSCSAASSSKCSEGNDTMKDCDQSAIKQDTSTAICAFPSDELETSKNATAASLVCDLSAIRPDEENRERRLTLELENSITDISVLKRASQSLISAPQSSTESNGTGSPAYLSKVTLRRKQYTNSRDNLNESLPVNAERLSSGRISRSSLRDRLSRSLTKSPAAQPILMKERTSTPVHKRKSQNNLLRNVLTKDNLFDNLVNVSNISNVSVSKKFQSRVKMPNFAEIHQKALDKVEDIGEYQKRKAERAKALLSGNKPSSLKMLSSSKAGSSNKQLRFDISTELNEKPSDFIPLPNTPKPKFVPQESEDSPQVKAGPSNVFKVNTPVFKLGTPKFNFTKMAEMQKQQSVPAATAVWKPTMLKNRIPVRMIKINGANEKNKENLSRVKMEVPASKPIVKNNTKEQMKDLVRKERPAKSQKETNRNMLRGVRLNRRFHLLMQKRGVN